MKIRELFCLLLGFLCASLGQGATITARSGSQSDVAAAVAAAADGDTVVIPDGTWSWTGNLTIQKAITLHGESASGTIINNSFNLTDGSDCIDALAPSTGNINIYWIRINQLIDSAPGAGYGLFVGNTDTNHTVMVHDCTFDNSTTFGYPVRCNSNGAIFWNDTFIGYNDTSGNGPCGILHAATANDPVQLWNTPDTYGTADTTGLANTYIEDCTFRGTGSFTIDMGDNSRIVERHCTISNGQIGSHGQDSGQAGLRQFEIYNNTFIYTGSGTSGGITYPANMQCSVGLRGGSGVIFGNTFASGPPAVLLDVQNINRSSTVLCQTGYPAARQVGQGWSASSAAPFGHPVATQDGIGAITEGVYLWNNTGQTANNYVVLNQYTPDECGNGQLIQNYVQQGRDYFFTPKPNYTPYTYPHPLHAKFAVSGGGTPASPQNLRVVN